MNLLQAGIASLSTSNSRAHATHRGCDIVPIPGTKRKARLIENIGALSVKLSAADLAENWHELEQHRFVHRVAETMERLVRERKVKALVVVAPPRTLADLRAALESDHCRNRQGSDQASSA